jgi:hypothetical protein
MPPIEDGAVRLAMRGEVPLRKTAAAFFCVLLLKLVCGSVCAPAQAALSAAATADPAPAIIQHMVELNAARAQRLRYFTSRRHYHIEFRGLGRTMAADMHAQVTFVAGAGKTFQVVDESGSRILLNHVLRKLLETERDDSLQQKASLTPENYDFSFQGQTSEHDRPAYIFAVSPKRKNKLLYRGKIWVDAEDYAVVRVEAQPAENPSFWIKSTEINHAYAKSGEFWLPQSNRSESQVRFGGSAVLTIDYGTYQLEPHEPTPANASE